MPNAPIAEPNTSSAIKPLGPGRQPMSEILHWRAQHAHRVPAWLDLFAAAVLWFCLAFGLLVPKLAGLCFLLLGAVSIVWLSMSRGWRLANLAPLEKLLVAAVIFYVVVWLASWGWNGLDETGRDGVGRAIRLLLIIPLLLFASRAGRLEWAWWHGLTIGALLAGLYAWWFYLSGQSGLHAHRVEGPTNPIYFGGLSLAFAVILLARVHDHTIGWRGRAVITAAILMATSASILSASRGAWLVLPLTIPLYWLTLGANQSRGRRVAVILSCTVIAAVVILNPYNPVGERSGEALSDLRHVSAGMHGEGTLWRRMVMWQIAWQGFLDHPLRGQGPGGFKAALESAVDQGFPSPDFLAYRHPHSAYLSALSQAGLLGLLSLLLLFAYVLRHHIRVWHTGLHQTRLLGWAGMAGLMTLMVLGLTESIFERNTGVVWFSLMAALPAGMIHARRWQTLNTGPTSRIHTLSVIIICKNEADRIQRCLASVSGWADEVIVLDSGSDDQTVEIARRFTARVFETDWPGYGHQKQRALNLARSSWVLSLDADEALDKELRQEIDAVLSLPKPQHNAYALSWLTHAFGRTLSFGRWARTPVRLVERDRASFTLAAVHEKIQLEPNSRVGLLEAPLHHWVFRNQEHARLKLDHYAQLQAKERFERGRRVRLVTTPFLRASLNFLDNYLLRTAVLDGRGGWTMSRIQSEYTYKKYAYLRALGASDG